MIFTLLLPTRFRLCFLFLALLAAVSWAGTIRAGENTTSTASSTTTVTGEGRGGVYRVTWSVFRASDNLPLASVSSRPFGVGASADVRTDSTEPTEERPAFPQFTARLSPNGLRPGTLELVTRVYLREAFRTKKGKLKQSKRVIGGLLPMRGGETQGLAGPGDPLRVDVHLERTGTRR